MDDVLGDGEVDKRSCTGRQGMLRFFFVCGRWGEKMRSKVSCDAGRQQRNESSWATLYEANAALERVVCSDVMLCCGRGDGEGRRGGRGISLVAVLSPSPTRITQAALDVDDAAHPGHHHCVSAIVIGELLVELA
jgi:hypothetical protein